MMKKHAFAYLNFTQFLGVMNDNFFKLILIFMLLEVQGFEHNDTILSMAGAIFVIPFLLFSIPAGAIADRFAKNKIVIFVKAFEVIGSIIGCIGLALHSQILSYSALFLLATSGALFGPAKYGIVPELVSESNLSKSNGYLSSSTFLAVIIGTFLAGPITSFTDKNFTIIGFFSLFFAILGFISSLLIPKTKSAGSTKKIPYLFFTEVFRTLNKAKKVPYLRMSIIGSAYFLFIGGYTQLNIIPYAVTCLGLSDIQGSYLFLITALGIGGGSLIAGKLSGDVVELGLAPIGAIGMTIASILLSVCSLNLIVVGLILLMFGLCGGFYLVPLDSYIQAVSPSYERGQNVATNNFMGFLGVLIASSFIYLFGNVFKLEPADGFLIVGLITLAVSILYTIKMWSRVCHLLHKLGLSCK